MSEEWEVWAAEGSNGNVACKKCGREQSPTFFACIYCCSHDELETVEDWRGDDDHGRWEIDYECSKCGKNFFSHDEILHNYRLVRKQPIPPTGLIVLMLKDRLKSMGSQARMDFFGALTEGYCTHCGADDPDGKCQCWNDE